MKDYSRGMCDLYSITTNQTAIIAWCVISRYVGNLAPSSMVELVVAVVGLASAGIFLAHAVAAYPPRGLSAGLLASVVRTCGRTSIGTDSRLE